MDMFGYDPLKIYYLVVIGAEKLEDVSPFQGFSPSWPNVHWALRLLVTLPADVLERSYNIDDVITQRMGGLRPQSWIPINLSALEGLKPSESRIFTVVFTGEAESARRTQAWIDALPHPVLHISTQKVNGCCYSDDFTDQILHQFCLNAFEAHSASLDQARRETAKSCLLKWKEPQLRPSGLKEKGHNVTLPNYMSLLRASRSVDEGHPFIGRTEAEYTSAILESIRAVDHVRDTVRLRPFHRMTLIEPPLILTEPALYRDAYKRIKPEGPFEQKIVAKALRSLQTQKGLSNSADADYVRGLMNSPVAQSIIKFRQAELETHTLGVGLLAAQSCSAVMRLSPGVNHVFSSLSEVVPFV